MKKVLIVSPNFPPVNAADMQRVRLSLPFYKEYGWEPIILTIDPEYNYGVKDDLLLKTVPEDIEINYVKTIDQRFTNFFGLKNPSIRAILHLYKKGLELIKKNDISLVFFSTTSFHTLFLGRLWKQKTNVPFVIDIQDPWYSDKNYEGNFKNIWKYKIDKKIHKSLESWTMKRVDGIISVSQAYIETLRRRYKILEYKPCQTITFGVSETDFNILDRNPQKNRFFEKNTGQINGVYIGRGGKDMEISLRIIFKALKNGLEKAPNLFEKIKLFFVGTDYAPSHLSKKTVLPIAEEFNVSDSVEEYPSRITYFESLQILKDSDFLLVPGSEEAQYSASKIYPYILSKKPMIAVFHESSPITKLIHELACGEIVSFSGEKSPKYFADELYNKWKCMLEEIPFNPSTDWDKFKNYTAECLTKEQCNLFDKVVDQNF